MLVPNVCAIGLYHYSRVSLSIGDRRILRLLRIILRLNFDEVCLFYSDKSDDKKKNCSQKCVILALSRLLYIPIKINNKYKTDLIEIP